jgi:hypothetical protein
MHSHTIHDVYIFLYTVDLVEAKKSTSVHKRTYLRPSNNDAQVEFPLLFLESIPKMLGLKKLELTISVRYNEQFIDMVRQCIGGQQPRRH